MSTTVIHTIEHDIGIDGVLEIRLGDSDVRLRGIEGTTVRVSGDPGDDLEGLLALDRGAGSLSIRPDRRGPSGEAWHAGRLPDLAIDAPRGATLVVDASSGDITAESFIGEQRYRSASGDIRLRGVTGRLTVEAVSGDVDATILGESAISARTVSGDLALRAATIATLRATTTSGDIRLAGRLDGQGPFTIESVSGDALLALAGDVRVDLPDRRRRPALRDPGPFRERPGKRSMTFGSGGPTLSVRTMSGDVRIVRATPVTRDEREAALAHEAPPTVVVTHHPAADEGGRGHDRCHRRRPTGHPSHPRARRDRRGRGDSPAGVHRVHRVHRGGDDGPRRDGRGRDRRGPTEIRTEETTDA